MKAKLENSLRNYPGILRLIKLIYRCSKNLARRLTFDIWSVMFSCIDSVVSKDKAIWLFAVHYHMDTFSDNSRVVFEEVKSDPSITKVILILEKTVDAENLTNTNNWENVFPKRAVVPIEIRSNFRSALNLFRFERSEIWLPAIVEFE